MIASIYFKIIHNITSKNAETSTLQYDATSQHKSQNYAKEDPSPQTKNFTKSQPRFFD